MPQFVKLFYYENQELHQLVETTNYNNIILPTNSTEKIEPNTPHPSPTNKTNKIQQTKEINYLKNKVLHLQEQLQKQESTIQKLQIENEALIVLHLQI